MRGRFSDGFGDGTCGCALGKGGRGRRRLPEPTFLSDITPFASPFASLSPVERGLVPLTIGIGS